MATKEEFLASIQRQKDKRQSRAVTRNLIQSEISDLIGEGKVREAYAKYEELPVLDQIGIAFVPGIGDALAAYEVGEFGTRGTERLKEGDVLGGLGNFLISGLAGASLIPVLRAGRGLTRVARVGDDMAGGSSSMLPPRPNEYVGTRPKQQPVDDMGVIGIENLTGQGLASPNREAIKKLKDPKKLGTLVSDLRKEAPGKEGELRLMNVLDENNNLTPEIQNYFRGVDKVTPAGLDAYLASNQKGLNVTYPDRSIYKGSGVQDRYSVERAYRIKDLQGSKLRPDEHYNRHYDNVIAFDSSIKRGDDFRVNRIQSDYEEDLRIVNKPKVDGPRISPYKQEPLQKLPADLEEIKLELIPLVNELNQSAKTLNNLFGKQYDKLFNPDDTPKYISSLEEIKKIQEEPFVKYGAKNRELTSDYRAAQDKLSKLLNKYIEGDPSQKYRYGFKVKPDLSAMPRGMRNILERELFYKKELEGEDFMDRYANQFFAGGQKAKSVDLRQDDLGSFKYYFTYHPFGGGNPGIRELTKYPTTVKFFGSADVDNILKSIREGIEANNEKIVERNKKKYRKDPYATDLSTKGHVFPTRSLVNEAAQITDAKFFKVDPMEIRKREGLPRTGYLEGFYNDIGKELEKISRELDLPTGSVIKAGTETILNLDNVRKALREGKSISAFKEGGFASRSIADALNNL